RVERKERKPRARASWRIRSDRNTTCDAGVSIVLVRRKGWSTGPGDFPGGDINGPSPHRAVASPGTTRPCS
ncbi:MAG: hypothetical protein M3P50_08765, partial [Actinomycetota bacterium]|nr:hypothetical protein [Actinomycetota bacterium]